MDESQHEVLDATIKVIDTIIKVGDLMIATRQSKSPRACIENTADAIALMAPYSLKLFNSTDANKSH